MNKYMNKLITAILTLAMLTSTGVTTFAYNYTFSSGVDYSNVLGKSTSTDNLVTHDPMTENIRRNKDASYYPPSYGVFSGDIPTEPTSLYHDNSKPYSGSSGNTSVSTTYSDNSTGGSISPNTGSDYGGMLESTSISTSYEDMFPPISTVNYSDDVFNTLPLYYDDGSIGTLSIPKLNLTVKVYEGETLDNMKIGVGHFEFTSVWDGNVAIAGHNRGVPVAIGGIKDLDDGDEIIYTTKYGTRTYAVYDKQQITDTDYSTLGWSDTNIITMITCVQDVPNMRWSVAAREK